VCAGYKNFHLFHIAFRTFIFSQPRLLVWVFPCGRFRVDNSNSLPGFPILTARVDKTVAPRFVFPFVPLFIFFFFFWAGLFILARLECVGVAAGDVGRIGFGFVCYAQIENADNIIKVFQFTHQWA